MLDGTVIGKNMQRHRHQEFIRFLNRHRRASAGRQGRPRHPRTTTPLTSTPKWVTWLDRHQRFTFHFTPTSCSWLNAVEGFFAKLSKRPLKRGVFHSVVDLQAAINRFLVEHNQKPKPFTWTADPDKIIAAVKRGHQVLDSIH
nr:transposase [Mesorhizobium sp.]